MKAVTENNDLMIINKSGIVIRLEAAALPVLGRSTQGVRAIRIDDTDEIADVAVVPQDDEEDVIENVNEILNDSSENEEDVTNEE
jgi:DNA gyrase subunit A